MYGNLKSSGHIYYETLDHETNKLLMHRIKDIKDRQFGDDGPEKADYDINNFDQSRVTNYTKLKHKVIKKELLDNYGSVDNFIEYNWVPEDPSNKDGAEAEGFGFDGGDETGGFGGSNKFEFS